MKLIELQASLAGCASVRLGSTAVPMGQARSAFPWSSTTVVKLDEHFSTVIIKFENINNCEAG